MGEMKEMRRRRSWAAKPRTGPRWHHINTLSFGQTTGGANLPLIRSLLGGYEAEVGRKLLKANPKGQLAWISRFHPLGWLECPDRRLWPPFALQPLSLQGSVAVSILLGVSSLKAAAAPM
jgi:hypothetical protein